MAKVKEIESWSRVRNVKSLAQFVEALTESPFSAVTLSLHFPHLAPSHSIQPQVL